MSGVTCIIPAYNEASRIAAVLQAVVGHPEIDEVIVVDDGSSDGTAEVAATVPGARLIRQDRNRGKTWAVTTGLEAARHTHVLLVDADLLGLGAEHLSALIRPVVGGHADISISLRDNAPWVWRAIGLDYISGERVLARDLLLGQIEALRGLPRFGLEVYMNRLCISQSARIAVVRWNGVKSPYKNKKYGVVKGLRADVRMMGDIFRSVPPRSLLRQIVVMRRLRVASLPAAAGKAAEI